MNGETNYGNSLYHRILLGNKKEWILISATTLKNLQRMKLSGKKSFLKSYILYDFIYITFFEMAKV